MSSSKPRCTASLEGPGSLGLQLLHRGGGELDTGQVLTSPQILLLPHIEGPWAVLVLSSRPPDLVVYVASRHLHDVSILTLCISSCYAELHLPLWLSEFPLSCEHFQ